MSLLRLKLFRVLAINLLLGVAAGWFMLALIFVFDIAGLRTLTSMSGAVPAVVFMLMLVFGATFGALAMGSAVMLERARPGEGDHPEDQR